MSMDEGGSQGRITKRQRRTSDVPSLLGSQDSSPQIAPTVTCGRSYRPHISCSGIAVISPIHAFSYRNQSIGSLADLIGMREKEIWDCLASMKDICCLGHLETVILETCRFY